VCSFRVRDCEASHRLLVVASGQVRAKNRSPRRGSSSYLQPLVVPFAFLVCARNCSIRAIKRSLLAARTMSRECHGTLTRIRRAIL